MCESSIGSCQRGNSVKPSSPLPARQQVVKKLSTPCPAVRISNTTVQLALGLIIAPTRYFVRSLRWRGLTLVLRSTFLTLSLGFTAGCSGVPLKGKDGTIHHLIIGIGVVSTPGTNGAESIFAQKAQVLGVHASTQPGLRFAAGYASSLSTMLPVDSVNALVEIEYTPFGALVIQSWPSYQGECDGRLKDK